MPVDQTLTEWRKQGKHLPRAMRDFHVQKEIFQAVHDLTIPNNDPLFRPISWVEGHVYCLDTFLWFMARHGYTLQKSRAVQAFEDLGANVKACTEKRQAASKKLLLAMVPPEPPPATPNSSPLKD